MEPLVRCLRRSALRGFVLLGALGQLACYDFDFGGGSGGNGFHAPVQLGGLVPADGSEMLDAAFATAGMFDTDAFVERHPTRVVTDRQSRPLVVGFNQFPFGLLILRLTAAGASDPTFGTNGRWVLPNEATTFERPFRAPECLLDASDRILLLSTRRVTGDLGRALVLRLEPNGVLDPTFGDRGRALIAPGAAAEQTFGVGLVLDPTGRILVCVDEAGASGRRVAVARLEESGALDASFGTAGIARGPEEEDSRGARVLADSAGGVVIAGTLPAEPGRVALWRFDEEGSPAQAFGAGGLVARSDPNMALDLAAVDATTDAFGRIYLLGNRSHDLAEMDDWPTQLVDFKQNAPPVFDAIVWRFLPDGALDPSFAEAGSKILAFNSGPYVDVGGFKGGDHFDVATGLLLDELDRVVIAGWSEQALWDTSIGWATFVFPTCPFLVRLTASGTLDPSFHGVGHAQLGSDPALETITLSPHGRPTAFTRDAAGRWLLAGNASTGSPQRVWRIEP